ASETEEAGRRRIERERLMRGGRLKREGRREAVAEVGGISPEILARDVGIALNPHVGIGIGAVISEEVEERPRAADRKARELHEREVPERAELRAAAGVFRRGVLRPKADVGAQHAVFSFLAN